MCVCFRCVYEGVHRLLQRVFILSAERDYVMECAGYCRIIDAQGFTHVRARVAIMVWYDPRVNRIEG